MQRMGFFGKLPGVGDFVTRGWSTELCAALDSLLQAAMASAYAETAARVIEGQPRAVALSIRPGAICASGLTAVLAPSEDRVGRFFPICVGLEFADEAVGRLSWPVQRWTNEVLERILDVQVAGRGPDALMAAMPDAAAWAAGFGGEDAASPEQAAGQAPQLASSATQFVFGGPLERLPAKDAELCSQLGSHARVLGVVMAEDGSHAHLFADRSALSWSAYAALFDGRWAHWGWELGERPPDGDAAEGDELETRPPSADDLSTQLG